MGEINLSDGKGRDAKVGIQPLAHRLRTRWIDEDERQAATARLIKGAADRDADALVEKHGDLDKVGEALIAGDPEVDFELFGSRLTNASRVYVTPDGELAHRALLEEQALNPDGSVRETRPRTIRENNTNTETPLKWSGKFIPKKTAIRKFVFHGSRQIRHVNGLTYDFLNNMAKDLEEQKSLLILGSGKKGMEPLIFSRGGSPQRGFLEGRTDGEKYALILHLTNMELKRPDEK